MDDMNPYRAPLAVDAPAPALSASGVWAPAKIDVGDVLGRSWRIFQGKLLLSVLVVLATMVILVVIQLAVSFATSAVFNMQPLGMGGNFGQQLLEQTYKSLPASLVSTFAQVWLHLGMMIFCLKASRGLDASFGDVLSGSRFYGRGLAGSLLFQLAGIILMSICLLPAMLVGQGAGNADAAQILSMLGIAAYGLCMIVFSLLFSPFYPLLVDRDLSTLETLRVCIQITSGNRLSLFALFIVLGLIMFASAIPCGVGLIFSLPYMMLTMTVAYLRMTSQPTADEMA